VKPFFVRDHVSETKALYPRLICGKKWGINQNQKKKCGFILSFSFGRKIIINNNKSIYIALILSSAKRFTMQEKDLVKK